MAHHYDEGNTFSEALKQQQAAQAQAKEAQHGSLSGLTGSSSSVHDSDRKQPAETLAKREYVAFNYNGLEADFLHAMAEITSYADVKYEAFGGSENYKKSRLSGPHSPINHIYGHLKAYRLGQAYDHFDGEAKRHLVAIAYNAMMEYYYVTEEAKQRAKGL